MKVLLTYKFSEDKMKALSDLGYDIVYRKESELKTEDDIKDIDILVCAEAFSKVNIDEFSNLKWIQLLTTGVNQVPKDVVLKKDITLTNNKLGYNVPIGEWIVLKILEIAKNSKRFYKKQDKKIWKMDTSLTEIYGKTVGFLGTGDIAKEASKRLEAFGVNIIGVNSSGRPTDYFKESYSMTEVHKVSSSFDYLVITLPYTEKTHNLVDKEFMDQLKDGVSIINIARGTIIDQDMLIKNLKNGKVKAAALDVFKEEPLDKANPLWEMDNVIVTPHNSWASDKFDERRFSILYENLKRYKEGESLKNLIDLNKGY